MTDLYMNDLVMHIHGRLGARVYYTRKGKILSRSHVIPANPRTAAQQQGRTRFAALVKSWQALDPEARARWNKRARNMNMSGYNLYISSRLRRVQTRAAVRGRARWRFARGRKAGGMGRRSLTRLAPITIGTGVALTPVSTDNYRYRSCSDPNFTDNYRCGSYSDPCQYLPRIGRHAVRPMQNEKPPDHSSKCKIIYYATQPLKRPPKADKPIGRLSEVDFGKAESTSYARSPSRRMRDRG